MKISLSMMNRTVFYKLGMVAVFAVAFQACKPKIEITDNNEVVSKPYSLFIGDMAGEINYTNDGYAIQPKVKSGDGVEILAIALSGNNVLYIQDVVHIIEGIGNSHNPIEIANTHLDSKLDNRWGCDSRFLDWPKYNRIYFAGDIGLVATTMAYNDSNGKLSRKWQPEGAYPQGMDLNFKITSFTLLHGGTAIAYDDQSKRTFYCDNPINNKWQESTGDTKLPTGKRFFLTHLVDVVIAVADTTDVYYSTNNGKDWKQYTGIPAGTKILSATSPNDKSVLVGTDGRGVFRLDLGKTEFRASSDGLPANSVIKALTGKYNYYKNDKRENVVFAGTPSGVYKSYSNGENWSKALDPPTNITAMH